MNIILHILNCCLEFCVKEKREAKYRKRKSVAIHVSRRTNATVIVFLFCLHLIIAA